MYNTMKINLILLFLLLNIAFVWIHWFLFESFMPYWWLVSAIAHLVILINFKYSIFIKQHENSN